MPSHYRNPPYCPLGYSYSKPDCRL